MECQGLFIKPGTAAQLKIISAIRDGKLSRNRVPFQFSRFLDNFRRNMVGGVEISGIWMVQDRQNPVLERTSCSTRIGFGATEKEGAEEDG
jgi:hypothetical protein